MKLSAWSPEGPHRNFWNRTQNSIALNFSEQSSRTGTAYLTLCMATPFNDSVPQKLQTGDTHAVLVWRMVIWLLHNFQPKSSSGYPQLFFFVCGIICSLLTVSVMDLVLKKRDSGAFCKYHSRAEAFILDDLWILASVRSKVANPTTIHVVTRNVKDMAPAVSSSSHLWPLNWLSTGHRWLTAHRVLTD